MYTLQAHQFILGHSLDVVQVKVLQAHQVVVVVDIDQVVLFIIVVVVVVIVVVVVVVVAVFVVLITVIVIVPQLLCQRGRIPQIETWIEAQHLVRIGARIATWA